MIPRLVAASVSLVAIGAIAPVPPQLQGAGPSHRSTATLGAAVDSLIGIFEGRTPCGDLLVEFAGYAGPSCEKMKWWLAFYRSTATGEPTRYEFKGTRVSREGAWREISGATARPDAVIYQLTTTVSPGVIHLLPADENVLLLLDDDLRIMVGDASWSYALNRTK